MRNAAFLFLIFFALFVVPVGVVIGVKIYQSHRTVQRRLDLAAFARSQGWQWLDRDPALVARFPGEPFKFSGATAVNVLRGQRQGYEFIVFDVQYVIYTGKTTSTETCTVWVLRLPTALPWLVVGPERGGRDDLATESEAFNQAYRVDRYDDRYAMAVLHPRLMELLLAAPRTNWRIVTNSLLSWEREPAGPERIVQRLDLLVAIAGLIPSYVWKDYGRTAGAG